MKSNQILRAFAKTVILRPGGPKDLRDSSACGPRMTDFNGLPKTFFFWFLVTGNWLLWASDSALACPGCTEIIRFGGDAFKAMLFGKGIAWSMALMFAVPFLLVGGIAAVLIRSQRQYLKAQQRGKNGAFGS